MISRILNSWPAKKLSPSEVARCVMHVHSNYATVLASLADSRLPPIDQNAAMFFNRYVINDAFGGLALEDEGNRCAQMLSDPQKRVMVMGNHGLLVIQWQIPSTDSITLSEQQVRTFRRCRPVESSGY